MPRTVRAMIAVGRPAVRGSAPKACVQRREVVAVDGRRPRQPKASNLAASGSSGISSSVAHVGLEAVAVDDGHQVVEALGAARPAPPPRSIPRSARRRRAPRTRGCGPPRSLMSRAIPMPTDSRWPSEPEWNSTPGTVAVRVPVDVIVGRTGGWRSRSRGEEAELGQRAVERRHVVALGQEQVVALGIGQRLRRDAQHAVVEVDEEVRARERRADEAAAVGGHANRVLAHLLCLRHQPGEVSSSLSRLRERPGRGFLMTSPPRRRRRRRACAAGPCAPASTTCRRASR